MNGGQRRLIKPLADAFRWVSIIIFAYIAALYLGSLIAEVIGINSIIVRLSLHCILLVIMLAIVIWSPALASRPRLTLADIGIKRALQWRDGLWGILGFIAYAFIMAVVAPLIDKIAWFDANQPQQLGFNGMSGFTLFAGFIVLAIITPIAEEILFRGILQGKLRGAGIPFTVSALIVGGLFAVAHMQWNVAIDVFFMSLVASYLRETTGRLWPSIIIHITKNTLAFYVTFVLATGTMR